MKTNKFLARLLSIALCTAMLFALAACGGGDGGGAGGAESGRPAGTVDGGGADDGTATGGSADGATDGGGSGNGSGSSSAVEYGNTSGNIKNGGKVAIKDGWVYFVIDAHFQSLNGYHHLFKVRTDGSDLKQMPIGHGWKAHDGRGTVSDLSGLYVVDDRIFLRASGFHVRLAASGDEPFYETGFDTKSHHTTTIKIEDKVWVYRASLSSIMNNSLGKGNISRGRYWLLTDENTPLQDKEAILENMEWEKDNHIFFAGGGRIFYESHTADGEATLSSMTPDGKDIKQMRDFIVTDEIDKESFVVDGDTVYFTSNFGWGDADGYYIYAMNFDGTDRRTVLQHGLEDGPMNNYSVLDGWIYYLNGDSHDICRVKTDGSGGVQVLLETRDYCRPYVGEGKLAAWDDLNMTLFISNLDGTDVIEVFVP